MKKICTWLLILAMLLTCLPPVSLASQADGDGRIRPAASRQDHNTLGLRDSTAQTMQPETIPEDQPVDIIVLLDDSRLDQKTCLLYTSPSPRD